MRRNLVALVVGVAAGMCVNMGLVMLNAYVLFPMPPGTDVQNPEAFQAYVSNLPFTAFLVVMVAHLGQSFVGALVAARLGSSRPMLLAMIVGGLSLIGGVMNMLTVKGPGWMLIELPLYLVVAWLAGRMAH